MNQKPPSNAAVKNTSNRLKVRLSITLDERLAFVDSFCPALIASRFGTGNSPGMFLNFSSHPEPRESIILEEIDGEFAPAYSIPFPAPVVAPVQPRSADQSLTDQTANLKKTF